MRLVTHNIHVLPYTAPVFFVLPRNARRDNADGSNVMLRRPSRVVAQFQLACLHRIRLSIVITHTATRTWAVAIVIC